jgi:hypothetical protein
MTEKICLHCNNWTTFGVSIWGVCSVLSTDGSDNNFLLPYFCSCKHWKESEEKNP